MFWCSLPSFPFLWLPQTSAQPSCRAMTEAEPLLQKVLKYNFYLDSQSGFKINFSDTICGFSLHIIGHVWKHPVYPVSTITDRIEMQSINWHTKNLPQPDTLTQFQLTSLNGWGLPCNESWGKKYSFQRTQLCQQLPSSAIVRQCPWQKCVLDTVYAKYTQDWVISFIAQDRYNTNDFAGTSPDLPHKQGCRSRAPCVSSLLWGDPSSVLVLYCWSHWQAKTGPNL